MFTKRKQTVPHPSTDLYRYVKGRTFHNGAEIFAFETLQTLPLYSVIGPGTMAGSLRIYQPHPSYQLQAVPLYGLGGIAAGQMINQPLVNNNLSPLE